MSIQLYVVVCYIRIGYHIYHRNKIIYHMHMIYLAGDY